MLLAATTQPSGVRHVTDIPATGFYWFIAIGVVAAAIIAWVLIRHAVRSALRAHERDRLNP